MPGPRGRPKKTDRRTQIVQAAIRCFIRSGVAQTRTSEIATTAKVDQPLISYYFPSPEDLQLAVIQTILESLKEESLKHFGDHPGDPIQTIRDYVRGPFEWIRKEPGYFSLWLYFYYRSSLEGPFRQMNAKIRRDGRDRIATLIYQAREKGALGRDPKQSVAELAWAVQGIITGQAILFGTEPGLDFEGSVSLTNDTILTLIGWSP